MKKAVILFVCIGILMPVELQALVCYKCSGVGGNCGKIDSSTPVETCTGANNVCATGKGVIPVLNVAGYVRSCLPLCTNSDQFANLALFCCSTDRCNRNAAISSACPSVLLIGGASLLLVLLRR